MIWIFVISLGVFFLITIIGLFLYYQQNNINITTSTIPQSTTTPIKLINILKQSRNISSLELEKIQQACPSKYSKYSPICPKNTITCENNNNNRGYCYDISGDKMYSTYYTLGVDKCPEINQITGNNHIDIDDTRVWFRKNGIDVTCTNLKHYKDIINQNNPHSLHYPNQSSDTSISYNNYNTTDLERCDEFCTNDNKCVAYSLRDKCYLYDKLNPLHYNDSKQTEQLYIMNKHIKNYEKNKLLYESNLPHL
jgi:hypothetical protein